MFLQMGFHYKIYDNDKPYFITTTIVDWIKIFTQQDHKDCIVESLQYCQKNKGLEIYAWCLMPDHLHMIVKATNGSKLSNIMRDFKRHTSKKIIDRIIVEPESNREWMLNSFRVLSNDTKGVKYKIWKDGYHPVELSSSRFTLQKLNYIHNNPVKGMLVDHSWKYMYSSARNYADIEGLLEIIKIGEQRGGTKVPANKKGVPIGTPSGQDLSPDQLFRNDKLSYTFDT